MREVETIIVGGGPAGSTFAGELLRNGRECLVLERQAMPRPKLCAGWITPKVLADLAIEPGAYPHAIVALDRMRLILGRRHRLEVTLRAAQFSIRRVQFDAWLLARSGAEVVQHTVRRIGRDGQEFVVDGAFRCRTLVGAGGTACPVRRLFFPERTGRLLITREVEFPGESLRPACTLWFPFAGRGGYAWCVPKGGAVNVGFGAPQQQLAGRSLTALWEQFVALLRNAGCLDADPPPPHGHPYFVGDRRGPLRRDGVYVLGDAAALATWDLAEGIGPAVESGLLAARDLLGHDTYSADRITRHSLGPLGRMARTLAALVP